MAVYTGEMWPAFSRAVDDEDDEEEIKDQSCVHVRLSPIMKAEALKYKDGKLPCGMLIVAIGPEASGFAQTCILNEDYHVVGTIVSGKDNRDHDTHMSDTNSPLSLDKLCHIYRSCKVSDTLICMCKTNVNPEHAYTWVEQLFSIISTDSPHFYLTILCAYMSSEYRSDMPVSYLDPPFLRALTTTHVAGKPLCPYLEQPNLVSGLPAQLLTYCQVHTIKAALYVCYVDSMYLNSTSVNVFKPLLKSPPIGDFIQENPKSDEMMSHVIEQCNISNTLYL